MLVPIRCQHCSVTLIQNDDMIVHKRWHRKQRMMLESALPCTIAGAEVVHNLIQHSCKRRKLGDWSDVGTKYGVEEPLTQERDSTHSQCVREDDGTDADNELQPVPGTNKMGVDVNLQSVPAVEEMDTDAPHESSSGSSNFSKLADSMSSISLNNEPQAQPGTKPKTLYKSPFDPGIIAIPDNNGWAQLWHNTLDLNKHLFAFPRPHDSPKICPRWGSSEHRLQAMNTCPCYRHKWLRQVERWAFTTTRGNVQNTRFPEIANKITEMMSPADFRAYQKRPRQASSGKLDMLGWEMKSHDMGLWERGMKARRLVGGQMETLYR